MTDIKTKLVVFDLYNTLVHITNRQESFKKLAGNNPIYAKKRQSFYELITTREIKDMGKVLEKIYGWNDNIIQEYLKKVDIEVNSVEVYPEVISTLKEIKEKGYEIAILSNLAYPYNKPVNKLGLDKMVDYLGYSYLVGYNKPYYYAYKFIEDESKKKSKEILMIGDSKTNDYLVPKQIGWGALLLDRNNKHDLTDSISSVSQVLNYL